MSSKRRGVEYGYNFALPDDVKITNENVLDFIAHFYVSREDEYLLMEVY